MAAAPSAPSPAAAALQQRHVWRWHFYAGMFCVPLVLWLATTGSLYLFKPQIEAWIDRAELRLSQHGPLAAPSAQVAAALSAFPGAQFASYELPPKPGASARVMLRTADGELLRVHVDPRRLTVLKAQPDADRLMPTIARLHGKLGIGDPGSWLVELTASWAIVMIATGVYLGWPRDGRRLAGVLWPRLDRRGRPLWRDLHAVIGVWVSAFALFLLLSGLPWTSFWGSNLRALRAAFADAPATQDWTTRAAAGPGHGAHADPAAHASPEPPTSLAALDRLLPVAQAAMLPAPVLIVPPSIRSPHWQVKSDTANRPQRVTLTVDAATAAVLRREDFAARPLADRIIGTGIAAHEGQLFGLPNQLLGLFTALSLIALCISAVTMWVQRRPPAVLGAPPVAATPLRLPPALIATTAALAVVLPLFGLSLLAVWLTERTLLRRLPGARTFLGLAPA